LALRLRGFSFRRIQERDAAPSDLVRLDTCFSIGIGLSMVDTLRGAVFQSRHTVLALQLGEPFRVARAMALEAGFSSIQGPRGREAVARLLERSRRLAAEVDRPYTNATSLLAEAVAACESAEWARAVERADAATQALRRCSGVRWERVTAEAYGVFSLYCLGDYVELARRMRIQDMEARQSGDLYGQVMLVMDYAVDLAADDPAAAEMRALDRVSRWPRSTFDIQQFWHVYALCEIDLYRGRGAVAYRRIARTWDQLRRSMLTRVHVLAMFAHYLDGRCAIRAAVEGDRPALAVAERAARRIERARAPWATPFADIIRAGIAGVEQRTEDVARHLDAARVGLIVAGMRPWLAAVSMYRSGADDRHRDWFTAQAIKSPERLTRLWLPGVEMSPASR
jgi:hypothetical protein